MTTLVPLTADLWAAHAPQHFFGIHVGTRMTIVRLRGGGLFVHSPVPLDEALQRAVAAIGPVQHLVCPNLFHHLHAGDWARAYPAALLSGPEALARKRPDLRFHAALSAKPHADWADDLVPVPIDGSMLGETAFVHPRSRTLVSADLTENFETSDHLPTRLYLKASGVHGKVGWSRLLRFVYRDRRAARASVDRLLEHDFDRVVLAHGRIIESGGAQAVRDTFTFLPR